MRHVIIGLPLAVALIGALLYWDRYWISSGSMKPSLLVGDVIVTEPLRGAPERGDVVVFRSPSINTDFVFRVVGLPGDRVQFKNGQLFLNDIAVAQQADGVFSEVLDRQGMLGLVPRCRNVGIAIGDLCEKDLFVETLPGGKTYGTLNIATTRGDNTGVYTVPGDQFFVLGDNRDNANDSRFLPSHSDYEFVPADNIHSRAIRIVFSFAGNTAVDVTRWRTERFGMAIE